MLEPLKYKFSFVDLLSRAMTKVNKDKLKGLESCALFEI